MSPQPAPAPAPDGDARTLARALAFSHLVARRSATQVVRTPSGFAVLHRGFPDSYEHNRVVVTGAADPAATLALADRVLGGAGLPHRHVAVDHDRIHGGWEDAFAAVGYAHGRLVLMAARSQPDRPAEAVVERLPYHQLAATVAAGWRRTLPDASEAVVQELVARRAATAAACTVTHHAVRRDGVPVSRCDLYRLGTTAQLESVETEPGWEGRGFARAVVLDAVGLARHLGCRLVFLVADEDDWPRVLYRRLGFVEVGRVHEFERAAAGSGATRRAPGAARTRGGCLP